MCLVCGFVACFYKTPRPEVEDADGVEIPRITFN
ncbi:MAG: hypothetical protein ACK55Z_20705 [bacterium]